MALGGYGRAGVGPSVFRMPRPGRLGPGRTRGTGSFGPTQGFGARPPAAAGVPQAAPAAPAAQPASPIDATYLSNIANEQFKTANDINAINQQSAYGKADLQKALTSLAQQKPIAEQKTQEGYNKQGLLYSGHLGQALGQQEQSFGDRQSALNQNFQRAEAARQSRLAAIHAAQELYGPEQYNAAVDRASRAAAADQTLGVTPISAPTAAAPQVASQKAQPKFSTRPGRGGVWHVYPGGRQVFVRR